MHDDRFHPENMGNGAFSITGSRRLGVWLVTVKAVNVGRACVIRKFVKLH